MSKRNLVLACFAAVILAQLAVPAWMIVERETTLSQGAVYKFRTQPVDPVDAFRGRYVWLRLEPDTVIVPDGGVWRYNQKAFAVLGTGTNGFAVVERLERERPVGVDSLRVRIGWVEGRDKVHIQWTGLDRFYMTERKAPAAEAAYRTHSVRSNQACHISVRVRRSVGVIENLYIENRTIQDWLRENSGKR